MAGQGLGCVDSVVLQRPVAAAATRSVLFPFSVIDFMPRSTALRFAILRHEIGDEFHRADVSQQSDDDSSRPVLANIGSVPVASGPVHWDWLFETDDQAGSESHTLRTFASDELAIARLENEIRVEAIELPPHRRLYLDFEGDIGQNRGVVHQVATGMFEAKTMTEDRLECMLIPGRVNQLGGLLPARLAIEREKGQWRLSLRRSRD